MLGISNSLCWSLLVKYGYSAWWMTHQFKTLHFIYKFETLCRLWVFRLLQQCSWGHCSTEMCSCITGWFVTVVLRQCICFILKGWIFMDISTHGEMYCPVMQCHIKEKWRSLCSFFSLLCILFDPSYGILAICMTFSAFIKIYGSLSQNFLTFAVSQYIDVSISGYEIWFKFYYFCPQCLGLSIS